jgi:ubiquinone/menaquinone biosynthesis C-methylase UbiE
MKVGKLARWYQLLEYAAFGRALERRRFAFLYRLVDARHVLILGEGDGRALARLLKLAPHARFDVVESSPEMVALARRRTGNPDRVCFVNQDANGFAFSAGHYDAVLTLFFLDCFTENDARRLIQRLQKVLAPAGLWLVSDFAMPPNGWRRWHAWVWIFTMYRFFGWTTGLRVRSLPPIGKLLEEAGLRRVAFESERAGLIVSEVWARHRLS